MVVMVYQYLILLVPPASPPSGNGHGGSTPPARPPSGNGGHATAPTPASPAPGNGGHGVPIPHPISPPASPPSGNGHGGPTPPTRPPSGNGGQCSLELVELKVCADVLSLVSVNRRPCCSLIVGLVNLEAAVCLCAAIKAHILGINLDATVAITSILNHCGREAPPEIYNTYVLR
ncbi:putative bifunctional inhibitor/plant lipid transfer protein/seed storage helical [Dioscorea sansibarensis]